MKIELENVKPAEIEKRSFEIITEELGDTHLIPGTEPIVKRCIHTSADFDYAKNLMFSEGAVEKALDAIRNGVVLAPEDRKKDGLCTKLSIRQNLALPNLDLVCNKMGVINSGKEDALCEKAVKDLRIKTPNVEIDSGNLSGGNQQKVVVGKWLARDSRVVIFDEPTRGIDVGAKVEIYNLMNELKKQGIAVMFVSSEMPEVMGIADRIIVMCDGRITGEVSAREATQDEILTMATSFENKGIKETEGGSKNE